jgi:dienelactone hydrolase
LERPEVPCATSARRERILPIEGPGCVVGQQKDRLVGRAIATLMTLAFMATSLISLPAQAGDVETVARAFVDHLTKEEYAAAVETFDATMTSVMPAETLKQTWAGLIDQVGSFKQQKSARQQKYQQYDIVFVTCEFERATLDVKVVLDSSRKVAGLFFVPTERAFEFDAPDYAKPDSYTERDVVVGTGKWELPGTLTVPGGSGQFAAVVLIHGSGPQDRDETIGPNKPFRDLAWGLASRGIAVLRYEKRTKQHAAALADMQGAMTVEEETIADALTAVSLLRDAPEIDTDRIHVLGHSLGGMLVPRIGQRGAPIAGFIIMAGTTRPLEDVILEQVEYLAQVDGQLTDDENMQIAQIRDQVQMVKSSALSKDTPSQLLPLGVPAAYWLDLRGYDPAREATKLTRPTLILQGERDYQVTMQDFQRWQEALTSYDTVCFKRFPALNHLFMSGKGKSTPAEYDEPGHVHESVISTIAEWIRKGCSS